MWPQHRMGSIRKRQRTAALHDALRLTGRTSPLALASWSDSPLPLFHEHSETSAGLWLNFILYRSKFLVIKGVLRNRILHAFA